jgi:hypothetical protein
MDHTKTLSTLDEEPLSPSWGDRDIRPEGRIIEVWWAGDGEARWEKIAAMFSGGKDDAGDMSEVRGEAMSLVAGELARGEGGYTL